MGDSATDPARFSKIACQVCRRRKIKCDRELPCCFICKESNQPCAYPGGPAKPGPKIGTRQRARKRPRQSSDEGSPPGQSWVVDFGDRPRLSGRPMSQPEIPATNTQLNCPPRQNPTSPVPAGDPYESRTEAPIFPHSPNNCSPAPQSVDIESLSFIVHPSHDPCTPTTSKGSLHSPHDSASAGQSEVLAGACAALATTPESLDQMLDVYFENFTSFTLFNALTFRAQIHRCTSLNLITALLAAMMSFTVRFTAHDVELGEAADLFVMGPEQYGDLALQYIEEAFRECGDDAPPLVLLQALVLATHQMLTRGVRGRAWRHLGTCVRVAYELNLHLIDSEATSSVQAEDAVQWCQKEERRRTWWAIWEMDTFASTIRRCPTAVDWSQNETYLPVEDEHWFEGKPHSSCFLDLDLTDRWKALLKCQSNSPKAWFIVVNSLMKEAQAISSPRGIYQSSNLERSARANQTRGHERTMNHSASGSSDQLSTIYNSLRCSSLALPLHLKYRNQYLGFQAKAPGSIKSARHLHSAIYSIHLMTQLTRFMIHHYRVFRGTGRSAPAREDATTKNNPGKDNTTVVSSGSHDTMAMDGYFEAADNVLTMVDRSCDEHYRYMNPFLASTVWLAAAVQLIRKEFCSAMSNKTLAKSKSEVLFLMYNQYVRYWNISTALGQNLDALEHQLGRFQRPQQVQGEGAPTNNARPSPNEQRKQSMHSGGSEDCWRGEGHSTETDRRGSAMHGDNHTIRLQQMNHGELLASSINGSSGALLQNSTQVYPPTSDIFADPMHIATTAPQNWFYPPSTEMNEPLSMLAPQTHDVIHLDGCIFDPGLEDSSTMLSSYLDELLSGPYIG